MIKFTETQTFAGFVYALLGLSAVATGAGILTNAGRSGAGLLLWPILPLGLAWNLLYERTSVIGTELTVTFGALFPLYRRRISVADIASAESVTYSPIADYGGWGIRGWGKKVALNARGNRGVRLTLRDGRRVLVGSQRPEELAEALRPPSPQ